MSVCIKLFEFKKKVRINSHSDVRTVGPTKTFSFVTRSLYKVGIHKKGFAFDKLLFFSA